MRCSAGWRSRQRRPSMSCRHSTVPRNTVSTTSETCIAQGRMPVRRSPQRPPHYFAEPLYPPFSPSPFVRTASGSSSLRRWHTPSHRALHHHLNCRAIVVTHIVAPPFVLTFPLLTTKMAPMPRVIDLLYARHRNHMQYQTRISSLRPRKALGNRPSPTMDLLLDGCCWWCSALSASARLRNKTSELSDLFAVASTPPLHMAPLRDRPPFNSTGADWESRKEIDPNANMSHRLTAHPP
jgi:hypothetical protein